MKHSEFHSMKLEECVQDERWIDSWETHNEKIHNALEFEYDDLIHNGNVDEAREILEVMTAHLKVQSFVYNLEREIFVAKTMANNER